MDEISVTSPTTTEYDTKVAELGAAETAVTNSATLGGTPDEKTAVDAAKAARDAAEAFVSKCSVTWTGKVYAQE